MKTLWVVALLILVCTMAEAQYYWPPTSGVDSVRAAGKAGSVNFANITGRPKGSLDEDTLNLYWDNTNKRLGIGTTQPGLDIEVQADAHNADISSTAYNGWTGTLHSRRARGSKASPTACLGGDIIGGIGGKAYDGSVFPSSSPASIHFVVDGDQSVSNHGEHINFVTTPTGSIVRSGRVRINHDGNVMIGDTTTPYHELQIQNTSSLASVVITATDVNKNVSSAAEASDTSSYKFAFTGTGKPTATIIGTTGNKVWSIDSVGGVFSGDPPTSDATLYSLMDRGFTTIRSLNAEMNVLSYNGSNNGALTSGVRMYASNGTYSVPALTKSGHGGFLGLIGHDGTSYVTGSKALISLVAAENWTPTNQGTYIAFGTTPTGSTTRAEQLRIDPNGNLGIGVTSWGTSATKVLGFGQATVPSTSPTDVTQVYETDAAAGDANLYVRNESGEVSRLSGNMAWVTTQFDKTSSTSLSNITGLSRNVESGATYSFEAVLFTTSNSAGGVQAAISGTATATSIIYEGETHSGGTITQTRATTLGTSVGGVTAVTAATIYIRGTIVVNAAGTLTVQFAQNASNGSASSVLVNSSFRLMR